VVGYDGKGAAINIRAEFIYGVYYCETFKFGDAVIGLGGVQSAGGIRYGFTGLFLSSLLNLHEHRTESCLAGISVDFKGEGQI
jgi:hypothetical protein